MIIRGFRPTSDIIDFTSVERCNQYYISRESHFKWRILSLEKIHCTKRNLKFLSIAVYCNKSMSDKELQIKKKFKPVLATKYWALLCCKLCKVNSTTVEQHQKKGNKVFTYCKNPELKAINRCRSKVKPLVERWLLEGVQLYHVTEPPMWLTGKSSNVFTKLKIHHHISIKKKLSSLWTNQGLKSVCSLVWGKPLLFTVYSYMYQYLFVCQWRFRDPLPHSTDLLLGKCSSTASNVKQYVSTSSLL